MTVDKVSKLASLDEGGISTDLEMEVQKRPSIEETPMFAVEKASNWFTILNDTLYKRGFSMPYLKCVNEEEAKYILEEIH